MYKHKRYKMYLHFRLYFVYVFFTRVLKYGFILRNLYKIRFYFFSGIKKHINLFVNVYISKT